MRIGELARKAGIAPSAIRYYEAAGLLPRAARKSGRRLYGDDALQRLTLIAVAQSAGFTLKEIAAMLQAGEREDWQKAAERKLADIDAKLEQLGAVRELLARSRSCGCSGLEDCSLYAEARSRL